MSNDYIITRKNYTIQELHKVLPNGNVFERDFMSTNNLGGYDSGSIPYSEGNFKMVSGNVRYGSMKNRFGEWMKNGDDEYWTGSNTIEEKSDSSEIKINNKSKSLIDYAYFSSAVELVKKSVNFIIGYFPAELKVSSSPFMLTGKNGVSTKLGYIKGEVDNPVIVKNPFNIKVNGEPISENISELRKLYNEYQKYGIYNPDGTFIDCIYSYKIDKKNINKKCLENGDLISIIDINDSYKIYVYYFNGSNILITDESNAGISIRPGEPYVDDFFDGLDDFQKVLLNKESTPIYTFELEYPVETENGISYFIKSNTWPIIDGWNIDIESASYMSYLSSLLDIATHCDENTSNNLWENYTHDAIKNMDNTFYDAINYNNDENDEGVTKLHEMLSLIAMQFDNLKRYIDNIGYTTNVSYDGTHTTPNYFLSDLASNSGWEVKNGSEYLEDISVSNLFSGDEKSFTTRTVDNLFTNVLKINSKDIFSRKGTKHSLEMMLSMFGLESEDHARVHYEMLPETSKKRKGSKTIKWDKLNDEYKIGLYDYTINEFITIMKYKEDDKYIYPAYEEEESEIEKINALRIGKSGDDSLEGLPVRFVYYTEIDSDGNESEYKYLIPWFNKAEIYDGKLYFQMYGGWGKREILKNGIDSLDVDGDYYVDFGANVLYDETIQYIGVVNNLSELKNIYEESLYKDMIYYVYDLSDYSEYYGSSNNPETNYFVLKKPEKFYDIKEAWECVPLDSIKNGYGDGVRVIYLENLIEDMRGNNPHIGFGKYDDGNEYLKRFESLFKYSIDNGLFIKNAYCYSDLSRIQEIGFDVSSPLVDNMKCWFYDNGETPIYRLERKYTIINNNGDSYKIHNGYKETSKSYIPKVGKGSYKNKDVWMKSEFDGYDFENGRYGGNNIPTSYSVMNIKNLEIKFNRKYSGNNEFRDYLNNVIMSYVKQLIPSTCIFKVTIENDQLLSYTCAGTQKTPEIIGVTS